MLHSSPSYRSFCLMLLACAILPGAGCVKDQTTRVLDTAYARGGKVSVRDQLGVPSNLVATLQGGEKLDILGRRNRWAQVRLTDGRTGWVHSQFLATPALFEQFRQLARQSATVPSQGKAVIRRDANLHVAPGTSTETFYRLSENELVEIFAHQNADRAERAGSSARPAQATPEPPEAVTVNVKGSEDWFLVRASGERVGWLRESFLDMSPPNEVGRYSEGLRVRAWFVLFEERAGDETHPWYLWATIHPRAGLPMDYDEIRVFVWNPKMSRYETSYRERNLIGYYPIQVRTVASPGGPQPAFSLQLEDPSGKRFQKDYKMIGRSVRSGS